MSFARVFIVMSTIAGTALAQAPAPSPAPELRWLPPLEIQPQETPTPSGENTAAYGAAHPDCLEWSDGCVICKKQPDAEASCSTAGAACAAVEPSCSKTVPPT